MATTSSHPSLAPRCGVLINSGDALQILLWTICMETRLHLIHLD
jgi:hypothetical protein